MKNGKLQYHYFYKITNNINGHFYYGVHNTNNLDDGYMGSGKRLHYAYNKYGIENFTKEILKFFESTKEAFEYESKIVNEELINNPNCYNIKLGGYSFTDGLVVVKNKNGEIFAVSISDPRYLSGELNGHNIGKVIVEAQGWKYNSNYGNKLIKEWSKELIEKYGPYFSIENLKNILTIYLKLDEDYKNSDFLNFDFFILETIIVPDMQENMQ